METWRGVAAGDRQTAAVRVVQSVADALPKADPQLIDWGPVILECYFGRFLGDAARVQRAETLRDELIDRLPGFNGYPGLYGGIAGTGWMSAHMDRLLGQSNEEAYDEVDDFLIESLRLNGLSGTYDLISGVVGLGVYFVERLPSKRSAFALQLILEILEERAEWDGSQARWKTAAALVPDFQRESAPDGYYNIGLAHGSPGIISLLALVARYGLHRDRCHDLATGAVNGVLSVRQPEGSLGQFPSWWTPTFVSQTSRLAWCYGDLGISTSLALSGVAFEEEAWVTTARDLAKSAAARRDNETRVDDPGLCHGSAGVTHLLLRLAQYTGDRSLRDLAIYWLDTTLDFSGRCPGTFGFRTLLTIQDGGTWRNTWQDSPQFLTGSTGAALALLASASHDDPLWDRVLLIS